MMLNAILLIFVIVTWGYSWVLMKIGLDYMGPFTLAAWRCTLGGLAMIPFLYIKEISLPKGGRWLDYAMVGLFQTTGMFAFMLYGMKFVSAGKTSVLLYTMSIWTSLLAHFYLKERLNTLRWLGVGSGSVGILCILGWDVLVSQSAQILFGEFLIILGAVSWALANIWVKKRMTEENTYMITCLQMIIGSAGLILLAFPTEGLLDIRWTWVSIGVILFTGLVASSIDFGIWFYLLKKLDTHTISVAIMLVPVSGLFFDWLIMGKALDVGIIVGGALILIGIYLVSRKPKKIEVRGQRSEVRIRN